MSEGHNGYVQDWNHCIMLIRIVLRLLRIQVLVLDSTSYIRISGHNYPRPRLLCSRSKKQASESLKGKFIVSTLTQPASSRGSMIQRQMEKVMTKTQGSRFLSHIYEERKNFPLHTLRMEIHALGPWVRGTSSQLEGDCREQVITGLVRLGIF